MNVLSYKIRKNEKQEEKKKKASQELTVCKAGVCKPNDHKNNHDNEVKINIKQKLEKKKKEGTKKQVEVKSSGKTTRKGAQKDNYKKIAKAEIGCVSDMQMSDRHSDADQRMKMQFI